MLCLFSLTEERRMLDPSIGIECDDALKHHTYCVALPVLSSGVSCIKTNISLLAFFFFMSSHYVRRYFIYPSQMRQLVDICSFNCISSV